jgi:CRP/FNR family transcriptional regulator
MPVAIPKQLIPNISEKLRAELQNKGSLKHFKAGEIVLKENANIKSIPIIISGSLKVLREDEDGKEIFLYYVKPGESCIMSMFGGLHNDTSKVKAIAEEDSELLLLPVDSVGEWIREYPEWIEFVLYLYHKRFEELLEVVNEIAFQKTDERIFNFLKKKSAHNNNHEISITHQQIADELGTSREVVSRLLKQLEKEDKISLYRNKIVLK